MQLEYLRVIKCISKHHSMFEQLRREADILNTLKHPGIPELFDIEEDEDNLYLIEEYIQGESLQAYLLGHDKLSQELVIQLGVQLCSIIEYLHSQKPYPILYLDFKPEHLLIVGDQFKLIDFGMCFEKGKSLRGKVGGTIGFVSPEQLAGQNPQETMDIYGIGSILYYAVSKELIQDLKRDEKKEIIVDSCSKQLKRMIEKATDEKIQLRYQSVTQLKKEFEKIKQSSCPTQNIRKTSQIAVIGSQHRIGATHLAIALTCFFNKQGKAAYYSAPADRNSLLAIEVECDGGKRKNGVFHYLNFKAMDTDESFYLGNVETEEEIEGEISIIDYGSYQSELEDAVLAADWILVLVGTKPWERPATEQLVKQFQFCKHAQIILNFSSKAQARKFSRSSGLRIGRFAYDEDPFLETREKNQLFAAILKQVGR